MRLVYAASKQMLFEKCEEQIRLPTSAHAGDDFDQSIVLLADQYIQVMISSDFHKPPPPVRIFADFRKNLY